MGQQFRDSASYKLSILRADTSGQAESLKAQLVC